MSSWAESAHPLANGPTKSRISGSLTVRGKRYRVQNCRPADFVGGVVTRAGVLRLRFGLALRSRHSLRMTTNSGRDQFGSGSRGHSIAGFFFAAAQFIEFYPVDLSCEPQFGQGPDAIPVHINLVPSQTMPRRYRVRVVIV